MLRRHFVFSSTSAIKFGLSSSFRFCSSSSSSFPFDKDKLLADMQASANEEIKKQEYERLKKEQYACYMNAFNIRMRMKNLFPEKDAKISKHLLFQSHSSPEKMKEEYLSLRTEIKTKNERCRYLRGKMQNKLSLDDLEISKVDLQSTEQKKHAYDILISKRRESYRKIESLNRKLRNLFPELRGRTSHPELVENSEVLERGDYQELRNQLLAGYERNSKIRRRMRNILATSTQDYETISNSQLIRRIHYVRKQTISEANFCPNSPISTNTELATFRCWSTCCPLGAVPRQRVSFVPELQCSRIEMLSNQTSRLRAVLVPATPEQFERVWKKDIKDRTRVFTATSLEIGMKATELLQAAKNLVAENLSQHHLDLLTGRIPPSEMNDELVKKQIEATIFLIKTLFPDGKY